MNYKNNIPILTKNKKTKIIFISLLSLSTWGFLAVGNILKFDDHTLTLALAAAVTLTELTIIISAALFGIDAWESKNMNLQHDLRSKSMLSTLFKILATIGLAILFLKLTTTGFSDFSSRNSFVMTLSGFALFLAGAVGVALTRNK